MNIAIFYFLHSFAFQNQYLDLMVKFIAESFIYIVILIITLALVWKNSVLFGGFDFKSLWIRGRDIFRIILSTGAAYILANVLKFVFHTDRPFIALTNIHTLISESGYAFPSGHSATIAAFAFAVFFKNKKFGYIALVAMVLIGLARVVAGVHFPVDIVGGYALGFIVAYLLKSL